MRPLARLFFIALILLTSLPLAAQQQQAPPAQEEGVSLDELVALPALLERAALATQAGDVSQAILDYSLFLLFNPTVSQAFHGRGISHAQNGDYGRALQDYERALDFSTRPEFRANIFYDRANIFLRQNRMDAALRNLDSALQVWPEDVGSRRLRARILAVQNRTEAALADYETLVELLPGDAAILLERGYFNAQLGAIDAAGQDFRAALVLEPQNPTIRAERAAFLSEQGKYGAALADIDVAIGLDPDNGGFYLMRGSLLQATNSEQKAAADYLRWMQFVQSELLTGPDLPGRGGPVTLDMQPGRIFVFPFEGSAGATLRASAISVIDERVDSLLVLTDDAGAALIADDDGAGAFDARIDDYVLPADGTYRLLLGHAGGEATGALRLTLTLEQG